MYFYLGKNPYAQYPQICGHEIAGTVECTGAGVEGLSSGTRVVVEPFLACGRCYPCRIGKGNCCANLQVLGVHLPGGYADFVIAPATHVHRVPAGLTPEDASFAEPVAIGVHACRRGGVGSGDWVLVLGCGPIGLAVIEVARARGAHVAATDVLPERLAMAEQLGAEPIPASDASAAVGERTAGEGAPVVVEASGNPAAMESAAELVAAGGRIVLLGLLARGVGVTFSGLDITRKEMTILGSRASVGCFPEALRLLADGAITYPRVATYYSLWDAPRVFAELARDAKVAHKVVFVR
jgi:threonine dehydrogenase-like Zn-dependent dehydrogenase